MANIGTFTAQDDTYVGSIRTLTLNAKVKFVPNDKKSNGAPDYRILTGTTEIGAAWKRTGRESERPYLSVTLDDPTFPVAIYAVLTEGSNGTYDLIWTRKRPD